ncbi:MAG TPA: hypothetical protein VER79_03720 [Candidatus Limnocylindrales bacterium]|nr:hypothetical protein [Candidatus Limnocylindrales bacterium]
MTDRLPTYHGSPEDEARLRLRESMPDEPPAVPAAHEIMPLRPDASNMQLNSDEASLQLEVAEREHRSFLNRLFGLFTGGGRQQNDMETELDRAIERYPESASNFVLRGELRLKRGDAEDARADFVRAYEIAAQNVADHQFGFVAQMTQDRALDGLERAKALLNEAE